MRENCHGDGEHHCCCDLPEDCTYSEEETMEEDDWRQLSENVSGHAMLLAHPHPEDGRECSYHHRLGVWTFEGDKECLRDHSGLARGGRDV